MRLPRNPFRSTKVESLESHDLFLRLFQPLALGALGSEPWDSVQLIRSAQGGGKTSLLRIFTPECLRKISSPGASSYIVDIAEALKQVDAIGEEGPKVLGLYLPLGSTPYATLARMNLDNQDPLHLFYALLDARIVLTALRGALVLRAIPVEDSMDQIQLSWPQLNANPLCQFDSASSLYEWAKTLEKDIWRAIDRGKPNSVAHLGHAKPYALEAFSAKSLVIEGIPVSQRILIMVDDAHKLAQNQRKQLLEHVITSRLSVSFWVAERMHAMEPYDLLAPDTSSSKREANPIILSMWWQKISDANYSKFYNELATKRMREVEIDTPFDQVVISDRANSHNEVHNAFVSISEKLTVLRGSSPRLSEIIIPSLTSPTLEDLISLKVLDLYIAGCLSREQQTLDLEGAIPMPSSDNLSSLRATAEYQVCTQFNLPLYYGAQTMYKLSSWNVDQFILLAAGLFDQLAAQKVRGANDLISAKDQQRIVTELAREYWETIPKRMIRGELMQRFLINFAKYAKSESLGATAKYPPGVTGFGITSRDHDRLRNCRPNTIDGHLVDLADLWSSAVAHNIIFMKAYSKQGNKGETVTVFYLNRLLCAYFGLPVGLGGWWKRKVDHFATLLKTERIPPGDGKDESKVPNLFETIEES